MLSVQNVGLWDPHHLPSSAEPSGRSASYEYDSISDAARNSHLWVSRKVNQAVKHQHCKISGAIKYSVIKNGVMRVEKCLSV